MEQQEEPSEKSNKWFKYKKTSPEKVQKITRVVGLIYCALALLIALNVWSKGNYDDAKSRLIWTIIFIIIIIIATSPKTNFYKRYIEFIEKKAANVKARRDKDKNIS